MSDLPEIILVIGARPNFMKVAPIVRAFAEQEAPFNIRVIHTGQHYDVNMSDIFLRELGLTEIDAFLEIGSGTHGLQTAKVMEAFERHLLSRPKMPSGIVVVGDVNSTLACALVAAKLEIPVAHVEAGLRSKDRRMPEEINRITTDAISDVLFVSEPSGEHWLRKEGIPTEKIFYVGNVMIDTLVKLLPIALQQEVPRRLGLNTNDYALVTIHRPANVDHQNHLEEIVDFLVDLASQIPVVFPVHPRTSTRLIEYGLLPTLQQVPEIHLMKPLGYLENLNLMTEAQLVLTDSGGIQEETTFLNVPCLTLRENTERPVTLTRGTNVLVGRNFSHAMELVKLIRKDEFKNTYPIEGWDGHAADRIVKILSHLWAPIEVPSVSEVISV